MENYHALESRIREAEGQITDAQVRLNSVKGRHEDLKLKLADANSANHLFKSKHTEFTEILGNTQKEIDDYPAIDPDDINEEALRENESDRKNELIKKLKRRQDVLNALNFKLDVSEKQHATANLEKVIC